MSMYESFETDPVLENDGIWLNYGDFRVKIASVSQGNKAYVKEAERKFKPLRKAIQHDMVSNQRSQVLLIELYAETIVKAWEVKNSKDEWVSGIEGKNGDVLPFSKTNVIQTLQSLPALFLDIQEQASMTANYRKAELEEEAKNSPKSSNTS